MQITETHIYRFSIPMVPFTIATGTMTYAQNMFIRIYTDSGLYGIGECSAFPVIVGETQDTCLAVARDFAAIWNGKDPLDIAARMQELDNYIAGNTTAKSAFDMALYDLSAKHAGQPLFAFLGGKNGIIETDITIGIGDKKDMAEKAKEFIGQGATMLKVKIGKDAREDVKRIRLIRSYLGPGPKIRIDANQGYSFEDACFALQNLEAFDIEFCEQPMRTYDDARLPELRKATTVKIMADESVYNRHDAERIIRTEATDFINIKLAKSAGMFGARKIVDVAGKAGMACMLGGMLESRIALTAKVHFALANPLIRFFDLDTCLLGHLQDPCAGGSKYNGYYLTAPDTPGIGADANEDFLSTCEKYIA